LNSNENGNCSSSFEQGDRCCESKNFLDNTSLRTDNLDLRIILTKKAKTQEGDKVRLPEHFTSGAYALPNDLKSIELKKEFWQRFDQRIFQFQRLLFWKN